MMTFKKETIHAMAAAVRSAIDRWETDESIAEAVLQAFVDHASLNDWDEIESHKP